MNIITHWNLFDRSITRLKELREIIAPKNDAFLAAHRGEFGQDIAMLVSDIENLGGFYRDVLGIEAKPDEERYRELLDRFIENTAVARTNKETIQKLLYIGFTEEELEKEFNFSANDVAEAAQCMDDYEDS